jgi:septal ring factor EnvC (AmiA/AmiB activator)
MVFKRLIPSFLLLLWLLLGGVGGHAQSLEELRKKKESAAEEIRYTNELLGKVDQNQKATLGKLRLLSSQIDQRNQLINTMATEVSLLQGLIDDNTTVVQMLTADLEKIREEYAMMVRFAWKNRHAYDKLLFFLTADSFNQAYRRLAYVRQYADYRRRQAETIASIQAILSRKTMDLENQQQTRSTVMTAQVAESRRLAEQKNRQNTIARELQQQKNDLRNKLAQQRRVEQQLEKEIQRIIEEEARKTTATGKEGLAMTPEQKLAGSDFEQNKRRIPWPVERGVITEKFGIHPHPVLTNVTVNNNGVNITTEQGTQARAVFKGEVSRVFGITGGNMAVILRHGPYLTVYSNLVDVVVKKGDAVAVRQKLGTVFTDANDGNKTILKFQIWKESQKLNPEEWLAR